VTLEIQIIPTSFLKKTKMTDTLTVVEREENKGKKKRGREWALSCGSTGA
jgi:hypothetical protein